MPLQTGQTINNRYRIVRLLGQGGFGAVYRAWDANLNRPCAVKENLDTSPEAQRQFAREASVLANLSHANLPRVTDHFSITGQGQYLVMDFIDGEDIATRVKNQGAVDVEQAVKWISQVADALAYLHSRTPPVVHRDIKPANIRITPDGRATLVDFGLVKLYSAGMQTTLGARAVTPGYAPPEQYGRGTTDQRTDIYALGATLYNILTAQQPYESVQRMVGKQMPPAHQINDQVPEYITQVIERAMSLEPDQRYSSAVEFKAALRKPEPTLVGMRRQAMPGRAQPRGQVAPTMIASSPVPSAPTSHAAAAPPFEIPSTPTKKRRGFLWWLGLFLAMVVCVGGSMIVGSMYLDEQRANATATSEAELQATLEARVEGTSTAQAKSTATPFVQVATVEQNQLSATEQFRENYIEELLALRTLVFGPIDGVLHHDGDNLIDSYGAGLILSDFVLEVVIYNPYSTNTGSWDYGVVFRHETEDQHYRLIFKSDGSWMLMNNSGSPDGEIILDGFVPILNLDEHGVNHIMLYVHGERGFLYVNKEFVADLDLSGRMTSGDIFVATGFFIGNEIQGEATVFEGFTVWNLP